MQPLQTSIESVVIVEYALCLKSVMPGEDFHPQQFEEKGILIPFNYEQTQSFMQKYCIIGIWKREGEEREGEIARIPAPSIAVSSALGIVCSC